ncbi:MAG: hypothetical protein LC745_07185 [Planctomycetia bacterium]|nr:hypothetical protein [Planctomycetia bacterium]
MPDNVIANNVIAGNRTGAGVLVSSDGRKPPLTQVVSFTVSDNLSGPFQGTYSTDFIKPPPTASLTGSFTLASDSASPILGSPTPGTLTISGVDTIPTVSLSGTARFPKTGPISVNVQGETLTGTEPSPADSVLTATADLNSGVIQGSFHESGRLVGPTTRGSYTFDGTLIGQGATFQGPANVLGTVSGPFVALLTRTTTEARVPVPHNPTGNVIRGNRIGIDRAGSAGPGNGIGVEIDGLTARSNVVQGNTITSSVTDGVFIHGGASGNRVERGTRSPATRPSGSRSRPGRGNGGVGVQLANGALGDTLQGNRVLSNATDGVFLNAASGNRVIGNVIADNASVGVQLFEGYRQTGASGNQLLGNGITGNLDGVSINGFATGNVIGGESSSAGSFPGNVVTGNRRFGINILGPRASGNFVLGNDLRGNRRADVVLQQSASGNTVGGRGGTANLLTAAVIGDAANRIGPNHHGL